MGLILAGLMLLIGPENHTGFVTHFKLVDDNNKIISRHNTLQSCLDYKNNILEIPELHCKLTRDLK